MKAKKVRIKVQFDKETIEFWKAYLKKHPKILEAINLKMINNVPEGTIIIIPYPGKNELKASEHCMITEFGIKQTWWQRMRARYNGLPCVKCQGTYSLTCKGVLCKANKDSLYGKSPLQNPEILKIIEQKKAIDEYNKAFYSNRERKSIGTIPPTPTERPKIEYPYNPPKMRSPPPLPDKPIRRRKSK